MAAIYSTFQIEQLKRGAKRLAKERSIPHFEALNLIARANGFPNWSVLMRRLEHESPLLSALAFSLEPFPDGDEGVFIARIELNQEARDRIGSDSLVFEVPVRKGWIVRPATEPQFRMAPYLSLSSGPMQGIFVDGVWTAIVSVNGGTREEFRRRIAEELPGLSAELRARVAAALDNFPPGTGGAPSFRLFWMQPQPSGVSAIADEVFSTLESAKAAELPDGAVPIGISTAKGWHTYQRPFGWQSPPELVRPPVSESMRPPMRPELRPPMRPPMRQPIRPDGPRATTPREGKQKIDQATMDAKSSANPNGYRSNMKQLDGKAGFSMGAEGKRSHDGDVLAAKAKLGPFGKK